jgi:hypothetical protein
MTKSEVLDLARRVLKSPRGVGSKRLAQWVVTHPDFIHVPQILFSYMASAELKLGRSKTFTLLISPKESTFTPTRIVTNAPTPDFVLFDDQRLARDALDYSPTSPGQEHHHLTPVEPGGHFRIHASYTGLVPPGYRDGQRFVFTLRVYGKSVEPS